MIVRAGNREDKEGDEEVNPGLNQSRGGSSLEQDDQEEEKISLEALRIKEFRQFYSPTIGLIWAGTLEDVPRLAA